MKYARVAYRYIFNKVDFARVETNSVDKIVQHLIIIKRMGIQSKLQTNNQTLSSVTKCEDGHRWWASFEFYPDGVGQRKSAFSGFMYAGQNFWSQRKCVVKFRNCGPETEKQYHDFIRVCEEVKTYMKKFNTDISGPKLTILIPVMATMDTVSIFNGIFRMIKRYDRVIHHDDMVLLEDKIEGEFKTFIDRCGAECHNCPEILQAFSHFTYNESKGKLIVTNLQGGFRNGRFILSSPVIHSVTSDRGPDDNGIVGISNFFARHKCNAICSKYIVPDVYTPSAPSWSDVHTTNDSFPTFTIPRGVTSFSEYCEPPPPYSINDDEKQKLLPEHLSGIPGVHLV